MRLFGLLLKRAKHGQLLASGSNDCMINIMDVEHNALIRNFWVNTQVTCLDINATSNLLIAGEVGKQLILLDIRMKKSLAYAISHSDPITSVKFNSDSNVVSVGYDGFCRSWNIHKWHCSNTITLQDGPAMFLNKKRKSRLSLRRELSAVVLS